MRSNRYRRQVAQHAFSLSRSGNGNAVTFDGEQLGYMHGADLSSTGPQADVAAVQATDLYYRSIRAKTILTYNTANDMIWTEVWFYGDAESIQIANNANINSALPDSLTEWREWLEGQVLGGTGSDSELSLTLIKHKVCAVPARSTDRFLCETVLKNVTIKEGRSLNHAVGILQTSTPFNTGTVKAISYIEAEYQRRPRHVK